MSSHDSAIELMREVCSLGDNGNPTYWPVPPRLVLSLLSAKDPVFQFLGWLLYCTVRWRHAPAGFTPDGPFPHRTPYAADEFGRPLRLKDVAAFFRPRWSARKARLVFQRVKKRGWAKDEEGKIWLRGDCPCPFPIDTEDGPPADPIPIDAVERFIASLPPYVQIQVSTLPAQELKVLAADDAALDRCEKEALAESVTTLRQKFRPFRHQLFASHGVVLKTLPREEKPPNKYIQLELFDQSMLLANLPKSLQSLNGHASKGQHASAPAQSSPAFEGSRIQQSSAVLNPTGTGKTDRECSLAELPPVTARTADIHTPPQEGREAGVMPPERDRVSLSAPPISEAEISIVLEEMRKCSAADDAAAAHLIRACRVNYPKCSAVQIAEGVRAKGKAVKKADNPVGALIKYVPQLFSGVAGRMTEQASGTAPPIKESMPERLLRVRKEIEYARSGT